MKKSNLLMMLVAGMMMFATTGKAVEVGTVPIHRVLLEEYTGTWCGWCIRGLVGMELLSESFGEEFMGVAYHYGDPMQTINPNLYPNDIPGFPVAFVERTYQIDPFYGFGNTSAGIISDIETFSNMDVNADLEVTAHWTSEDKTSIAVDVSSYFIEDEEDATYALEIMLLANDLYGTGSTWNQENYYAGYTAYARDPYLGSWVKQPETITGIHFNDVLLATTRPITNSLPKTIVAYEDYIYNYTLDLNRLPRPALVQNKDNLRFVVIIVDTQTGKAINANRCYINDYVDIVIGDVNDDTLVNISDVTDLIDYLLVGKPINEANADMNNDNSVTISDVTALIDYLLFNPQP